MQDNGHALFVEDDRQDLPVANAGAQAHQLSV